MDLQELDWTGIQNTFNKVLAYAYSININEIHTDAIFDNWRKNKAKYFNQFGKKLIKEIGEVEFHVDKEKRAEVVKSFLDQASQFISSTEYSDFYQFVISNEESFFDNLVSNTNFIFGKTILKGMKLSKAFKFFITNKDNLISVQQLASQYIQKDKIKGVLCASIHPLDFLSLSENTYNWRSCHSLDGDYCAGNLSYMADKTTIIWYLRGEDNVILPNFPTDIPWNSKKWRMLCFFDEEQNYCFLGRQYPFEVSNGIEKIRELLPGGQETWTPFINTQIHSIENYLPEEIRENYRYSFHLNKPYIILRSYSGGADLYSLYDVVKDMADGLHYNDLLYSSCYKPYYSSKIYQPWSDKEKKPYLDVGHDVKCVRCGHDVISPGEGSIFCCSCAYELGLGYKNDIRCSICGEWHNEDEIYYMSDGSPVCNDCINDGTVINCPNCGEYFFSDDMEYSEKYEEYYCPDCFADIAEEEVKFRKKYRLEE